MRNITSLDPGPGYSRGEFEWLVDADAMFSLLVELTSDSTLYDLGLGLPCRWDRADGTPITYPDRETVKIAEHLGYLEAQAGRLNERVEIDIFVPTEKGRQLAEQREGRTPCTDESVWTIVVERPEARPGYFVYFGRVDPEPEEVTGLFDADVRFRVIGPGWSWRILPSMLGLTKEQVTALGHAPLSHAELRTYDDAGS